MLFDHAELGPIARRQAGVASRKQILAVGISWATLHRAVERGEAVELQPGAYASCWTPRTRATSEFAAVLGGGCGAAIASLSALHHYGAWGVPDEVHICVGHGRRPRLVGIRVHRSRIWTPADTTILHGIPVTGPVRTVFDAAEILRPRTFRGAAEKMVIDGHVTWVELVQALRPHHGRHGLKRVRPVLEFMPTDLATFDSKLEADFLHLVEEAHLPPPEHHIILDTAWREFEVDFLWRTTPLAVEVDGPHHLIPEQRRFDSRRDSALGLAGWPVQRFLDTEIRDDPTYVISVLRSRLE